MKFLQADRAFLLMAEKLTTLKKTATGKNPFEKFPIDTVAFHKDGHWCSNAASCQMQLYLSRVWCIAPGASTLTIMEAHVKVWDVNYCSAARWYKVGINTQRRCQELFQQLKLGILKQV